MAVWESYMNIRVQMGSAGHLCACLKELHIKPRDNACTIHRVNLLSQGLRVEVELGVLGELVEGVVEHAYNVSALVVYDALGLLVPQHRHRILPCAGAPLHHVSDMLYVPSEDAQVDLSWECLAKVADHEHFAHLRCHCSSRIGHARSAPH